MSATLNTIKVGRRTYLIEPVTESDIHLIPARFILHHPRGRKYLLVPDAHRPEHLVAIAPITPFTRFRPTPLAGARFAVVEDGTLVIAGPDA